jgi:hypothetical protein
MVLSTTISSAVASPPGTSAGKPWLPAASFHNTRNGPRLPLQDRPGEGPAVPAFRHAEVHRLISNLIGP